MVRGYGVQSCKVNLGKVARASGTGQCVLTICPLLRRVKQFFRAARNRLHQSFIELQTPLQKKRAGALGQILAQVTPALLTLLVNGYDELSALHVDGHGFSKLKLERRLRSQLDVLLAGH